MKTIKFSVNSFLFKLWEMVSFYPAHFDRPQDICTLKRNLIFRIIGVLLSPALFLIWMIAFKISKDLKEMKIGPSIHLLNIALQVIGIILWAESLGLASIVLGPILLLLIGIISVGLIFLIAIGSQTVEKWYEVKSRKKNLEEHKEPMFVTLYNGWKEKLCSKIEYIDDLEDSY